MKLDIEPHSATEPTIVMRKTLEAPRELVWAVLTDPKHVARWYGGHGFENPRCEMDVRAGGRWRHVMRTPDGAEHRMEFVFVEVVRPERLVWRSAEPGPPGGGYRDNVMTVTLEEDGRRTRWKLVTRFRSLADRDAALGVGFTDVLGQGTEKVEAILRELGGDP
jgi:uncharacterized protein YndB with AHSA1/START domain